MQNTLKMCFDNVARTLVIIKAPVDGGALRAVALEVAAAFELHKGASFSIRVTLRPKINKV